MVVTTERSWPRAILLDFYSTVVHTDPTPLDRICEHIAQAAGVTAHEVSERWGRVFIDMCSASHGEAFRQEWVLGGVSLTETAKQYGVDFNGEARYEELRSYWTQPPVYPDTCEFLKACPVSVCLVSNVDNREFDLALKHSRLHFDFIVTSEDCRAYKPQPVMFKRALSLLDLPSEAVVHIGDSFIADGKGAQSLGIPFIWLNREEKPLPAEDVEPKWICRDLNEVAQILGWNKR